MLGRVPGTRPSISESHSETSTRVPICIVLADTLIKVTLPTTADVAASVSEESVRAVFAAAGEEARGVLPWPLPLGDASLLPPALPPPRMLNTGGVRE